MKDANVLNHLIEIKDQLARVETTVSMNNAVFNEARNDVNKLKNDVQKINGQMRHVKGFAAGISFAIGGLFYFIKEGFHKISW